MANKIFESWYVPTGCGSGDGSAPAYTVCWRAFLEGFIRAEGIRSVVDFGCGDWQFTKYVDWGDATYHGVDVVRTLMQRLQKLYARPGVSFAWIDDLDPYLPEADLLIAKDVLQHLSNREILRILPKFHRAKWWLLVNDQLPAAEPVNTDTYTGGYRLIDLTKPPFLLPGAEVFHFDPPWPKVALLVKNAPLIR